MIELCGVAWILKELQTRHPSDWTFSSLRLFRTCFWRSKDNVEIWWIFELQLSFYMYEYKENQQNVARFDGSSDTNMSQWMPHLWNPFSSRVFRMSAVLVFESHNILFLQISSRRETKTEITDIFWYSYFHLDCSCVILFNFHNPYFFLSP